MWDSIETQMWRDDNLRKQNYPYPWPDESTLLENLIKDSTYRFADDITTPDKKETVRETVTKACQKACAYFGKLEKEDKLAWGVF